MTKLHLIIELGSQPALCTVCSAVLTPRRHTKNNLINIEDGFISDGAQTQDQQPAQEHLQHFLVSPTLKTNKSNKGKKGGDKVDLNIKNVIFWNITAH